MKLIPFLLAIFSALTSFSNPVPVTVIPFKVEKNCIYIHCRINDTDSLKFLFDTGANSSVINTGTGKVSLQLSGTSVNTGSNGNNLVGQSNNNLVRFGSIERTQVSFMLIPFGTDAFDGVFGTDLMKGNVIEIDYSKHEMRFYPEDEKGLDLSGYEKTKLKMIDDYPTIQCTITAKGKRYKGFFGLDSGADDALTIASPFGKKHKLNQKMEKIGAVTLQGSDGSVYEMPLVLCESVSLGGKSLYNVPVGISSATEGIDASEKMAGFFGNSFLKRFNTVIDFKSEKIYFRLNNNLYSEF